MSTLEESQCIAESRSMCALSDKATSGCEDRVVKQGEDEEKLWEKMCLGNHGLDLRGSSSISASVVD